MRGYTWLRWARFLAPRPGPCRENIGTAETRVLFVELKTSALPRPHHRGRASMIMLAATTGIGGVCALRRSWPSLHASVVILSVLDRHWVGIEAGGFYGRSTTSDSGG